jgi:hypothetical protein
MHTLAASRAARLDEAAAEVNILHSMTRFRAGFVKGLFQQPPGPHVISPQGSAPLIAGRARVPAKLFEEAPLDGIVIIEAAWAQRQVSS